MTPPVATHIGVIQFHHPLRTPPTMEATPNCPLVIIQSCTTPSYKDAIWVPSRTISPRHAYPLIIPFDPLLISRQTALPTGNLVAFIGAQRSINSQFVSQQYSSDDRHPHPGVVLNPGVPVHYQNYRHIEHGQAKIIPSPNHPHFVTQQKPYPGTAAMQTQGGHAQYSKPTNNHSGSSATSLHHRHPLLVRYATYSGWSSHYFCGHKPHCALAQGRKTLSAYYPILYLDHNAFR